MTLSHLQLPDSAELDHREAMSKGGANDESNYQLLCRNCNGRKSDKDFDAFTSQYAKQQGLLLIRKP